MKTMAQKLDSNELAVFEAFVTNARTGLKQPQVATASGVPRMTVHRILKRFEENGVVVKMGKAAGSKAYLYRLNGADREVVEMGRAVLDYSIRVNRHETAKMRQEAASQEPKELFTETLRHFPSDANGKRAVPARQEIATWG